MGTFLSLDDLPCRISILLILNMGILRSYMAFTVQKRELTLENPFLYWKGFLFFGKFVSSKNMTIQDLLLHLQ